MRITVPKVLGFVPGKSTSQIRRRRRAGAKPNIARRHFFQPAFETLEQRTLLAVLTYSTYLGGSSNDTAGDVATDSEGNTYVIGTTGSTTIAGQDAGPGTFVTKFRPDGQIDYTTTLGPVGRNDLDGFAQSIGESVAIGPDGLPYVVYQSIEGEYTTYTSTHELHATKLDDTGVPIFDIVVPVPDDITANAPFGHRPPYSIGAGDFAVDDDGNAYVTYMTIRSIRTSDGGAGFPETDYLITKIDASGAVDYTEPLPVFPRAIAVDSQHNIYLTATTNLEDLPVSSNAFQPERSVSPFPSELNLDVYVAMLDPTATGILAGTYLGGTHIDFAGGIAVNPDRPGVVYLAGATQSPDFPLMNPFQQFLNNSEAAAEGVYDGFVTVLDLINMELSASTFLGGSIDHRNPTHNGNGEDVLSDIALDQAGNVYVVGETNALDFPVASPLQSTYTPGPALSTHVPPLYDFVMAKFDASLSTLEFSTYFGGSGQDSAAAELRPYFTSNWTGPRLAVDAAGTMHVVGTSKGDVRDFGGNLVATDDFPVLNAAQPNFAGGYTGNYSWDGGGASDAVVLAIAQRGTLTGRGFSTTQGREFNNIVAGFASPRQDASPADFTATIDWGDGTTSIGNLRRRDATGSVFLVEGIHAYNTSGAFPVVVRVEDHAQAGLSPITNIDTSHFEQSQTGGSIAADLTHPNQLFAAMTDERGEASAANGVDGGILVAISRDAGATWSPRLVGSTTDTVLPAAKRNPDVLFDKFGNLFLAYEGSDGNNIVVAWSTDGGKTFDAENVQELTPQGTTAGAGVSLVGSPKLAFNEFNNEIWVTFEDAVNDRILAAAAGVGGLNDVGAFDLQPIAGSEGGFFSDIAAGPDGTVAVAWQTVPASGAAKILASIDPDGIGPSVFSAPTVVTTSSTSGELVVPAQQEPVPLGVTLDWDNSGGPHGGRLYVAFADMASDVSQGPDEPTLFVTYADGAISNWNAPRRVTLDPVFQSMFLPSLAVDPVTGVMAVGWYGTRGALGTSPSTADFFVATSLDGATFSESQQVSVESSDALDPSLSPASLERGFGESPGMVFVNGRLYPLWSDNSTLANENNFESQFEVATTIIGVIDVETAQVAVKPQPIQVIKGQMFNGMVATFTSRDSSLEAGNFTASIQWGDGGESTGLVTQPNGPGTAFEVTGSHTYAESGGYPLWVRVHDNASNLDTEPVSNVTAQQGSQAEPTIAIDPSNPERVFAAGVHVNFQFPLGIPIAASDDGGVTWTSGTLADGTDGLPPSMGDTRAVFDEFGNLFVTYLSPGPARAVIVLLSTNGGVDFSLLATFTDVDDADQPSIAVGPDASGAGGSVWLTWERGGESVDAIMVAGAPVSSLGAVGAFQQRLVAPLSADGISRNFGDIAVGPAGEVLLTYTQAVLGGNALGPAQIAVHLDPDGLGPQPFGPAIIAADIQVGSFLPIPAQTQRTIDAEGNLAWDLSDGEHHGRVYLVYTDSSAVGSFDTDIFSRYSDDGGQHWTEPIQINDTDPNSQFLPSVAVDQSSGNVGVAWYTAMGAANVATRFTATLSDDGGSTWNRVAYLVSPGESDATDNSIDLGGQRFQYGDYSGLSFVDGVLQPIWADNSSELDAIPDPRSFDLANARIAVAEVTRTPLVVQTLDVAEVEGTEFTLRVATITDPDGAGAENDYRATIQWGDGSDTDAGTIQLEPNGSFSVLGTHEYQAFGHYAVNVSINGLQAHGEAGLTAVIDNAPLSLTFEGSEGKVRVVRETEFTKVLATLTDLNHNSTTSDFDATIAWGDGSFSDGIIALTQGGDAGQPNTYSISGTHKYLLEQTFAVTVTVRETATGQRLDEAGLVVNGDPPLEVQPGLFLDIQALEGINTGDLVLVTFTVPDDVDVQLQTGLGEYIATINWGDGQVDSNIVPFVTSEDVTVVGRHTYASAGEYFPSVTVQDDSDGVYSVPLIALVEPDVTAQVRALSSGLTYDPVSDRFVGDLTITNTSTTDISGPLYVVLRGLPVGVSLDSFTAVDGVGNPLYKVDQSRLSAGASLPPIALEFSNPGHVPISYTVQVFDGIRPTPVGGASLIFEPNLGQANDAVSFIARGRGYSIGLSAGRASLVLSGSATQSGAAALMEIVGASDSLVSVALDPQPGVSNYFADGLAITNVPHFGRVRYAEVYAGVDIEYYGRDGLLEYDWVVRPGADPNEITSRFLGVDDMVLDGAGNLRLQIQGSELVQRAPFAYQIVAGVQVEVAAAYEVRPDGTIGFTIGAYDPSLTLVIDPVLVYSSYLGGSGGETATSIAVDNAGNSYVAGATGSSDFFTVNPFDAELNQPNTSPFWLSADAFVTKFDPQGVPLFSTYLGGGSTIFGDLRPTTAHTIAVDAAGHVWVGGSTQSLLFPTTVSSPGGLEVNPATGGGFLTELSADGSSILYSSVISSTVLDFAVDDAGDVYATGVGFALKLDPETNTLPYHTAFGDGIARGIAVDSVGQAYLAGFTQSSTFPTKNALFPELHNRQPDEQNNPADGFVVKLSHDGNVLFSTYFGGSFTDAAYDIAIDSSGVIHVVGQTNSSDLPVPGGLDTLLGGTQDGFLIKLANDGSHLLYGTYVGGSRSDSLIGVGVDALGQTYVGGTTSSLDLPTVRAHQPIFGGGPRFLDGSFIYPDGFAASIAADGGSFVYLTYFGGGGFDELRGVAVDTAGNASYLGNTNSQDLLTRNPAQARLFGIAMDSFIVRLLAGDAGTVTLHNAPFTAVEGSPYNGLVAFFDTTGSETADQFSATIDWGDGGSTPGTITGDFRDGFQVLGSHLYADVGTHDVYVTLRDALGQIVTATTTGAVTAATDGRVRYHVTIDTAALAGMQGLLSFQFNPGAFPGSPDAEAHVTALNLFGGIAAGSTVDGDATLISSSEFTLKPSVALNRLSEIVTLGARIEFDLEFVGPGMSQPPLGNFGDVFALQLLSVNGIVPLLSADSTASLLRVNMSPDGSTHAESSGAAVTVAASGVATVANGPISLTLERVTIPEGLEFRGPVGTFTNGNPLENAEEFSATIDWGDGSPVTVGIISGGNGNYTVSGTHVYQTVGSYALAVTVSDPDGLTVRSTTGRNILAGLLFNNDWGSSQSPPDSRPVSGDFNGDGILDVAVGGFWPNPTVPGRGVGILLGRGDGSFELAGFQTTGQSAIDIAVADFNGDGKLDVAAAIWNRGESVVELLLGNGDGTVQPTIPLTELKNPGTLIAADFNRDGHIDLGYTESYAPTQHTGSVTFKIALNHGDGTFATPTSTAIRGGFNYRASTADMDGDTMLDIMLTSSSALEFLRGRGDGSFEPSVSIALGQFSTAISSSFAIEDFDADGQLDVAAVDGFNLNIFSGHGDGTFAGPLQIAASRSVAVVAGQFNGDGRPDLAIAVGAFNDLGRVRVFLNDPAGSFSSGVSYEGSSLPSSIVAADFDQDGKVDIATSGTNAVISVLPGTGDGTFASAVRYATGLSSPQNLLTPQGVTTADVNGDTLTDAVLVMSDGRIVTELGQGDGTFQSIVSGNINSRLGPLLADVNHDGQLDVIAPSLLSGIGVVLGSSDGRFPTRQVNNPTGATSSVALADFNQDGRLDMAGVYANFVSNRVVSVSLANADGTFQNAVSYVTGVIGGTERSIATGDFNADSQVDLVVANTSGTLSVLLGNPDGTFAPALNIVVGIFPFNTGISPQAARVGDFNGDGKLDLVAVGFSASGVILPGNGDGTFGASIPFATTILSGARDVAVGDFNSDSKLDIVIGSESHVNSFVTGGGLSVLLGNGNGTFQAEVAYFEGVRPTSVALGDFNQDGRLDIAAGDSSGGNVTSGVVGILIGRPDGTFQTPVAYSISGANPSSIAVGDLNGDGRLDVAVVNQSRDTGILFGNENGTFGRSLNFFTSGDGNVTDAIAVAMGDLNGDGRVDLVTGNSLLFADVNGTLPNRGLFTYLPPVINVSFQTSNPEDIAAGDLNGDGYIDLAVSMRGTTVIVFGNGNGSFHSPILLTPPASTGLASTSNRVAVVDMDGDGDLDVVTLHQNQLQTGGAVAMWRNNGSGAFNTPLVRSVPMPAYDLFGAGLDMELGDLNGDSFVDVVVTDSGDDTLNGTTSGRASVMLGIGDGSLGQPTHYLLPPRQRAYRVTLADLNRDGRPEIAALTSPFGFNTSRSAVAVFTNDGSGRFGPAQIYDHGQSSALYLAGGDFNSDGAADIIVPDSSSLASTFSIIYAGDAPVLVTDAVVSVTAFDLNPRTGLAFATTVANFMDANPFGEAGDFTATVNWGDGQSSTGSIHVNPLGGFSVSGAHTYAASGVFTTTVTVRETGEGTHFASATARVNALDQGLIATGFVLNAIVDMPFNGAVATFTDADPNGSLGDFSVAIDWGDGQTSAGNIMVHFGGGFTVIGSHTYSNPGDSPVQVSIIDIGGSTATANSTAQVAPHVNRSPAAIDDNYTANEDTTLSLIAALGALTNDTDADADTLTAQLVTGPTHGSLSFQLDGSFSYIPDANFSGTDRFTYRANDGHAFSDVATVNITVTSANDAPVANDDFTSTNEDTPVVINVIPNDSDVDGSIDPTSVAIIGQPNHGSVQVNSVTGAITYTPALNFFGSDIFRYRVTDTVMSLSNMATVLVTVNPVNDAPIAAQDTYAVLEDTTQIVSTVKGLLANDNDVDGDPITALLLTGPAHGILTLHTDGSFSYTPAANFFGHDSFVYAADDGIDQSTSATVSFTIQSVNDAPAVTPLSDYVIPAGSVLTRSGSFSDPDVSDTWTATVDYGDGSGVQSLALIGTTYTLNHDYAGSGTYSVSVIVTDDQGASGSDTTAVTVGNLPPVVNAGADQVAGEGATVHLTVNVSDPGSADTHTSITDWGDGTDPEIAPVTNTAGTAFISVNHIYVDNGVFTVTVSVTDGGGLSATDTLIVTVSNAVPQTDGGPDRTIQEGDRVRFPSLFTSEIFDAAFGTLTVTQFTGSFRDPGALDTHTGNIDWGDGTTAAAPIVEQSFSAPSSLAGSNGVVLADHSYGDNGVYTVDINVTDKDGGHGTDRLAITVLNVAPTVDAGLDRTTGAGALFELSADFRDLGVLDSHTAVIDWGDGTFDPALVDATISGGLRVGTVTGSHVYTSSGLFTAQVIVTDDDGGSNSDSLLVNVDAGSTALSITATSADKAEGNNGLTPFTFTVVRSGDVGGTTLVDFAVIGEGADSADFGGLLPAGQLDFRTGEVSHTITIFVRGDVAIEPDEAFRVTLSNATGGAEITAASIFGTIRNDEVVADFSLDCSPLHVGLNTCTVLGATPGGVVDLALGLQPGNRYMPQFGVTLGMLDPTIVAQGVVQPDGRAIVQVNISTSELLRRLLFEAFEQAPTPRTTNLVSIGTPLQSAAGQGPDSIPMSASDFYSMMTILRDEAIARWSETGLSSAEISLLHSASIEIADLAHGLLGQTIDHRILVDPTAAGHGWFVDATPTEDAEFSLIVSAAERIAPPGTVAAEHVDLLTVLMHEYGYILGRTDLSVGQTTGLMTVTLPDGVRRVPAWNPLDVNRDRRVSPLDVLLVINHLNSTGSRHVDDVTSVLARLDVNSDRFISPLDALIIINALNSRRALNGEGESAPLDVQSPIARFSHSAAMFSSPFVAFHRPATFETTATNQDRQVSPEHSMLFEQPVLTTGVAAAHADDLFARSLYDESLVTVIMDDLLQALATDAHRSRIGSRNATARGRE